ncbi:hypothetical protein M0811_07265 [Anaeramoeba ignava]|uniref:Uncharacterized protein n=1 Tax=Anaeramoeba ignava TaxID=1746090 RepID=A0A9Q0LML0_ANAIG|nr:hypothetical protein M0811_07265 [Anaeramoeba ignava]|eukprot:Anaeramoba_ignava/a102579_29.p1 GENE.a102579_29~~a102579_29.p1  ORF type:complete len:143 (-),score=37.93 a102579_29:18-446(-)
MSSESLQTSDWFPFPLNLVPKKLPKFYSKYEKPELQLESHFVEFIVIQKNIFKRKVDRKLQLDYYTKDLIIYTESDGVHDSAKCTHIVSYNPYSSIEPYGLSIIVKGRQDALIFWAKSEEDQQKILKEIEQFITICTRKKQK